MRAFRLLALCALAAAVAACSSGFGRPISGDDDALSPEERRLQTVENKLIDISRKVDNLSSSTFGQGGRMADEVRSLRGEVETVRNLLESNEQRGRQLYQDLDTRLRRLEGGGSAMPYGGTPPMTPVPPGTALPPAAPAPTSPPFAPPAGSPASAIEEENAYLQAFDLLKAGKYDDAIGRFQAMLERWPQGKQADNALYWMGEARYVKREYAAALTSFETLLQRFPNSQKAPDALLKIGFCQQELKQPAAARATLERLIREHPDSTAANLARQRLTQLSREGR